MNRGGVDINPPLLSLSWGIWEIGAKHDYCWLSSKDFFEIYNFSVAPNFRDEYAFLLKKSENQDDFLKSLFFDLQECVIPQKNPQKNRHSILK